MRIKTALPVLAALTLAGCGGKGAVIDFGPEPGTPGDPSHWHYQPELHGPNAPPREQTLPRKSSTAPAETAVPASPADSGASQMSTPSAMPALPPPPPPPAVPASPVSEAMFNDAIRRAVSTGEIDRALRLLEEAERLGSTTARQTLIDAIESR